MIFDEVARGGFFWGDLKGDLAIMVEYGKKYVLKKIKKFTFQIMNDNDKLSFWMDGWMDGWCKENLVNSNTGGNEK